MTIAGLARARRTAQRIEKLHRRVRWLIKKRKLTEAQVALSSFSCGDVVAVSNGQHRHMVELREAADELLEELDCPRSSKTAGETPAVSCAITDSGP